VRAPITITQEDLFFTCKYCGNSITLGSRSQIKKAQHAPKQAIHPADRGGCEEVHGQGHLSHERGPGRRNTDVKLRYLPFWVFPVDVTTSFREQPRLGAPAGIGGGSGSSAETIGKLIS
jgi:hypothetical protein